MLRKLLRALYLLALLAAWPWATSMAQDGATTQGLEIRGFRVQVEMATTTESRARGLMFRKRLEPDHGMLFVFDAPETICMWMRNTPLPLSVAFISSDGHIINIADMTPLSDQPHCSHRPAVYALEMAQGWFTNRGVGQGQFIKGLPGPKPPSH